MVFGLVFREKPGRGGASTLVGEAVAFWELPLNLQRISCVTRDARMGWFLQGYGNVQHLKSDDWHLAKLRQKP